jgi:hypothetical protein
MYQLNKSIEIKATTGIAIGSRPPFSENSAAQKNAYHPVNNACCTTMQTRSAVERLSLAKVSCDAAARKTNAK